MLFDKRRKETVAMVFAALCFVLLSVVPVVAKQAKPQGLWVGGTYFFSEFQGKALQQSGTPKARFAFASASYFSPLLMTFDSHQNLWVAFQDVSFNQAAPVLEISRGDLTLSKNDRTVKAKVIITLPENYGPRSVAFDTDGDLWVADGEAGSLLELLPSQIKKSGGASAPAVLITSNSIPSVMRFDGSNNLWVAELPTPYNPSNPFQLWRFAQTDRAASGPANPSLRVVLPDGIDPTDLAFDGSGNLWFAGAGFNGDAIEMISANDLEASGSISPSATVTITSPAFGYIAGSGTCLGGIDFDRSGDLWVSIGTFNADCVANGQVVEFTPTELGTGGNIAPAVTIGRNGKATNLSYLGPIRFGPTVQ